MKRHSLLAGLFLINACSLTFEVVASRLGATYLGATAYANTVLLAAFLAGIGAGGWAAALPRLTKLPGRTCAVFLFAAGTLMGVLSPVLVWLAQAGPGGMLPRAVLLSLLVAPVGFAVGFAYPALTTLHAARGEIGSSVASTYAADTVGAATGSIAAGFLLVPSWGLRLTGLVAGLGLALVAAPLLANGSSLVQGDPKRAKPLDVPSPGLRFVLSLFFATGLAALVLEVTWIRLFTLVIGTSLYSFALTVGAFLAALGIGSRLMGTRVDEIRNPAAALSGILFLTGTAGASLLLLAPVWERLYLAAYTSTGSVVWFQVALFVLGLGSILLPAGLMGAGFSLGVRLVHTHATSTSASIGRLYGLNTLGGVLGAIAGGLLLLPSVGIKTTVLLAASVYVAGGLLLWLRSGNTTWSPRPVLVAAATGAVLLAVGSVPEPAFTYAAYFHGLRQGNYARFTQARDKERILYRRFSPYGLVTATQDDNYRYLRHNGRAEASTAPVDMSTQLLIAHLPMLIHPAPQRVLNIGLGAGFTLGAIEQHPEARVVVQAELDPRIVQAAREHFDDVNAHALAHPRLRTYVTDGRKLLADDPTTYDVIVSEPSHLWVSGVSGLFTTEFYSLVARRLSSGGIFATWVPDYEMGPDDIQIVAATLLDVFPYVTAFENGPSDIIFLASRSPFQVSRERVEASLRGDGVRTDIAHAMEGFPLNAANLTNMLEQIASNSRLMPQSITAATPRNTDDWPVLEFHTALAAITKPRQRLAQAP